MHFFTHFQAPSWPMIRSSACVALLSLTALAHAQDQYLGAMMQVAGNYCPRGWEQASGQTMQISQNTALFSLLVTSFGGDGQTTFQLPDLRGRVPIGTGFSNGGGIANFTIGQTLGSEQVWLNYFNLPSHTHTLSVPANTGLASHAEPGAGRVIAATANGGNFAAPGASTSVSLATSVVGQSAPMPILEPSLGMLWCIARTGIYPAHP